MDKNLDVLVPEEFKGSVFNDIVNDQISTAHPYGPIAVAKMSDALSFMHASPVLYYVPDDPALGTFSGTFANKLCFLEERPNGKGWEHTTRFGNAPEIVNTQKMLTDVYKSSNRSVDQDAFLRVRLFDMTINDWDRHEDQWVWAKQKTHTHYLYTPIARDRDQAFAKTDGISLYLLSRRWALRSLQNMDPHIRDVVGVNFNGRHLDRQFLNELTKDDWTKGVEFIQTNLTDATITSAIHAMPAEVNKISGSFLVHRLAQRRNNLMRDALRYYSVISKQGLTLLHRIGASTIFGDYEFYQASTLSGTQNLRGYWRNRFAGKSSFYQNTDLRLSLFDFRGYAVRGKFGLLGFFDDGRVWVKDDNSSKLHTGYGGGVFLVPYNTGTLSLYYAKSTEASFVTLRAGFFF